MRSLITLCATAVFLATASLSFGAIIPGSTYILTNSDFESGNPYEPPTNWSVSDNEVVLTTMGNPGMAATCWNELLPDEWGNQISQIADMSTNVLWNPGYNSEVLDLSVDIAGDPSGDSGGGVRFQLEMWSASFNSIDDPGLLPVATDSTGWVEYTNLDSAWSTFNPFDEIILDYQPRWVRVNIEFMQPPETFTFVDNVTLTAVCVVPEPTTLLLLGLGALALRRKHRA